jgi:hypothetical protein
MALNSTLLKQASEGLGGPLTDEELKLLRDIQGFIAYGIHEGLSFNVILKMLRHDLDGLINKEAGFLPRIKGMNAELDRIANDPEMQREMREIENEFDRGGAGQH